MYKILLAVFVSFITVFCASCGGEDEDIILESPYISGLTTDNYPIVDGSTSTLPLNMIIACKLFGINYQWEDENGIKGIKPVGNARNNKLWNKIKSSQTHNSFINVIDKKADITLSARTMSPDERTYAESKGVSLIETPIALDAFLFIVNPNNPVESLTTKQIQDIYTGKIACWNEVGVDLTWTYWDEEDNEHRDVPAPIQAYVRNPNSGSQELMETLVMKDLDIAELPINEFEVIFSMAGALDFVSNVPHSICYTVYYYLEYQSSDRRGVKRIAVNGIYPDTNTIGNKSYPYAAEVYAVIRDDLDHSSMAYKIYEWIQTDAGKQVIHSSGYILN